MAVQTLTTWLVALTLEQRNIIQNKLDEMVADGKTDGIPNKWNYENVPPNPPPPMPLTVIRTWSTVADAEEFQAFLFDLFAGDLQSVDIQVQSA